MLSSLKQELFINQNSMALSQQAFKSYPLVEIPTIIIIIIAHIVKSLSC